MSILFLLVVSHHLHLLILVLLNLFNTVCTLTIVAHVIFLGLCYFLFYCKASSFLDVMLRSLWIINFSNVLVVIMFLFFDQLLIPILSTSGYIPCTHSTVEASSVYLPFPTNSSSVICNIALFSDI